MSSAQIALTSTALGALLLLAAGPGRRLGLWSYGVGLTMVLFACVAGLVGLSIAGRTLAAAATAPAPPWPAAVTAVLALGVLAVPAVWIGRAVTAPWVNDVTTDPDDPPFIATAGGLPTADTSLAPLLLDLAADEVRSLVRASARQWEIAAPSPDPESLTATASTFWFGFVDDVSVRVRAVGATRTRVLVPLAVDQAAVRCSYGHENVGSSAVPGSLRWTITGMRTTATKKRRERPRAVKMSLQFSRVLTTPACIAGVLVSRPNFNALCGRPKL